MTRGRLKYKEIRGNLEKPNVTHVRQMWKIIMSSCKSECNAYAVEQF